MKKVRGIKNNRGNMPFAVIAVTILVIALGYGVVSSQIEKAESGAENVAEETETIGRAMRDAETFVNRGLGELIMAVGNNPDGGTIRERAKNFETAAENWMDLQFPSFCGCVKITVSEFSVKLVARNMKVAEGSYVPSYLGASGSFKALFECDSATAERTIDINTDGSCALPLVAEQGSLFELSLTGEGSVLSQMMTYQLTALAQQRVINGYGSLAVSGNMGTSQILTEEDVRSSYRDCVTALELISFRNSSDGTLGNPERLDLGDTVAENGYLTVDLGAVYAQALISAIDRIVLQWADYFCGNIVVDFVNKASDTLRNAWDSFVSFISKKDTLSASPYVKEIMEGCGYSESEYRYLFNGRTATYHVPEISVSKNVDGEIKTLRAGGTNVEVSYPDVDVLGWGGLSNFRSEYRLGTNEITEWIRSILHTAASNVAADKSSFSVKIRVDRTDSVTFMESIESAVAGALGKLNSGIERVMTTSINNQTIFDPFYSAIANKIKNNKDEIFGISEFENRILSRADMSWTSSEDIVFFGESEITDFENEVRAAYHNRELVDGYRNAAETMIQRYDSMLRVPGGQSGLIKQFMTMICEKIMPMVSIVDDIPERMINICGEMCQNMNMNPYCGIIGMPGSDGFVLNDKHTETKESINVTDVLNPDVKIYGPNENLRDCVHHVGFNEKKGASYCTVFRVALTDELEYTANGTGEISSVLGLNNSSMRSTVPIDIDIKIAVVSGWGLAGVSFYNATNTVFSDGWALLVKVLEPLLEPLRKIVGMLREVMVLLNSALMELSKYVSKVIERIYDAVMGPIMELKAFAEEQLDTIMNRSIGGFANMTEYIFKATMKKQTVGISFQGLTLTFSFDLISMAKNVRNIVTISLSGEINGLNLKSGLTLKEKDTPSGQDFFLTGNAVLAGKDWDLEIKFDPVMKSMKHLVTMNGTVRGTSFDIVMPDLVQYRETGVRLSDIEGIGTVLSNIPLPALGLKGSLDAGLDIKYNVPFEDGVVINEVESNPPGEDSGFEWVELYNSSFKTVDISGYSISAGTNEIVKRMFLGDVVLAPHERLLVVLDKKVVLVNGKNAVMNGEKVILRDREGRLVDETPVLKDTSNSSYTWQRVADGAVDWTFAMGTPGSGNCGGLVNGDMMKGYMRKIFRESAIKALEEMDGVLMGTEDLSAFLQRAIQDAITSTIDMIAGCLVEASLFVSFEVSDAAGASATGIRIALSVDSKTVGNTLKYIVGEIEALLFNMENPYGIDGSKILYNDVDLAVSVYTGMATPKFLGGTDVVPTVKVAVYVSCNISGLCTVLGNDVGTWEVNAGIRIEDCPSALLPKSMGADPNLKSDLWLIRAVISEA